ncbi:MAG: hypothetical protein AAGF04_02240 [Chlamydiota bacterium]
MPRTTRCACLVLFFFSLVSCGYEWCLSTDPLVLRVPFVEGDASGNLTNALVIALDSSPYFSYSPHANITLHVSIHERDTETIGLDEESLVTESRKKNQIWPSENRERLVLAVCLKKGDRFLWGPEYIQESNQYDYVHDNALEALSFFTPEGERESSLQFSLGEFEGRFAAEEDASLLLYRNIAEKVAARLALVEERLRAL